ncbi:MAG: hypothetical protein ABSG68_21865 [Thermoguttaceae bacterium]|jgi:hypothetical protein
MAFNWQPSGYTRLEPRRARLVLAGIAVFTAFFLSSSPPPLELDEGESSDVTRGDAALYRAETDRIHNGENYYRIAAEELPARGYPTRSVFNWRTPLPMWFIGRMPTVEVGKIILCVLALALLLLAFEVTSREELHGLPCALPLMVLLVGPLLPCLLGNLFVMPVLWAGVLITISVCSYSVNRPYLGAAAGLAAAFFRELALPYCLLGAALAWQQKRRGELLTWLVGLAGWCVFFAWHWMHVRQLIPADAAAHREGWIQFGGARFVLSTVQMNSYLLLLPQWVTTAYFVAALFGLAGWHSPLGLRAGLTVCLFVLGFSIVGQEFNRYWGLLITPLLCFGVVRAPASLADLWRACQWTTREAAWR